VPHLDSLRIAGYKSIRDQTIELQPLNVLIGANGAGKSNFIGVFRFLGELFGRSLRLAVAREGGPDRILFFGRKKTDRLVAELRFPRGEYSCELVPTATDSMVFGSERITFDGQGDGPAKTVHLGMGHQETALADLRDPVIQAVHSWTAYHFHDTSAEAKVKQTGDLNDNAALRPDAGNLAAYLYRLQETQPASFRNIVDVIRMAAPFFDSFNLRPNPLNPDTIRLEWQEVGSDGYFDANSLSDGTLRFISLVTLLLQPELPSILLLDEPELGLHPYAITVLADLLRSAATRAQIVVSTQSVTLVNQFSPEDVIVVDRIGGESVFRRLSSADLADWMDDYALGELWEKNVLGGRPSR
jgi:predicted ATPase